MGDPWRGPVAGTRTGQILRPGQAEDLARFLHHPGGAPIAARAGGRRLELEQGPVMRATGKPGADGRGTIGPIFFRETLIRRGNEAARPRAGLPQGRRRPTGPEQGGSRFPCRTSTWTVPGGSEPDAAGHVAASLRPAARQCKPPVRAHPCRASQSVPDAATPDARSGPGAAASAVHRPRRHTAGRWTGAGWSNPPAAAAAPRLRPCPRPDTAAEPGCDRHTTAVADPGPCPRRRRCHRPERPGAAGAAAVRH